MKQKSLINIFTLYFFLCILTVNVLQGQTTNCVFKPPIFSLDFGSATDKKEFNQSSLRHYEEILDNCPNDGYYSFVSRTSDCYGGNWITLNQDHTPNDLGGKMMLVNSAYAPGTFFVTPIADLAGNTTYELSAWMVNVCMSCNNEVPLSPQFNFIIENTSGKQLANFVTSDLRPTRTANWIEYSGLFTTPSNPGALILRIANKVRGGCGNDFAMDDIKIRECALPKPIEKVDNRPKPTINKPLLVKKTPRKDTVAARKPVMKVNPVILRNPVKDIPVIATPVLKQRQVITLPKPLQTRANPIIKQIETGAADIVIDLYDNGDIDGDTVSIYHNNVLIVSRSGLSEKAVTFHVAVDASHPHHELVMVANNLGSIPPNTSLMIITARDKRYEVFISSSEQKNAKIVIDLKE